MKSRTASNSTFFILALKARSRFLRRNRIANPRNLDGERKKMQIKRITASDMKSEICNGILRSLPLWFGIETAIVDYVQDVRAMETWAAFEGDQLLGFASINRHFEASAEIHVMGIKENFHRKGIGRTLLNDIENELRKGGVKFLTVKTLSASRLNKEFDQTRNFYLHVGFTPLEEFKTLWGEANPCLLLVKGL